MGLDDFLNHRPAKIDKPPFTGTVVATTPQGPMVAPLGGDTRHPLGPCRGGTRLRLVDGQLVSRPLPVGTTVLLVHTSDGLWVANYSEGA